MKLNDFEKPYRTEIEQIKAKYMNNLDKWLHNNHLDGLVVFKEIGKIGRLSIVQNYAYLIGWELKFYPIKKNGEISLKAESYISNWVDIENQFAPYKENEEK